MDEERAADGRISRRRLLKRMGAGAAVAWLAPVVSSFGSPASATCSQCDPNCTDFVCGGTIDICGSDCYCDRDSDNVCQCWQNSFCSQVPICTDNSDCSGYCGCFYDTCCGSPVCIPCCGGGGGGAPSRQRRGRTAAG